MLGPFVTIVKQIVEALISSQTALSRRRERGLKRDLVRLFFDLLDFEETARKFIEHTKRAVENRNTNSLNSAFEQVGALHAQLEKIVGRFLRIAETPGGRYLLEVADTGIGRPLATAFGGDSLLLHEWALCLRSFVRSLSVPKGHLDPQETFPALDTDRFQLGMVVKHLDRPPRQAVTLQELIPESEQWLETFRATVETYRDLVRSQVSLEDVV